MKRKIALVVIGIAILIVSSMQIAFAYMKSQVIEDDGGKNITINTCSKIQLLDSNSQSLELKNTYPMDDNVALETIKPYEFIVTNSCDDYSDFTLYLTSLSDNEINDDDIRFALTDSNGVTLLTDLLSFDNVADGRPDFTEEELTQLGIGINGTPKNIYKIYSDEVNSQGSITYKLYLWVDKDTQNDTMDQTFKLGLSVRNITVENKEQIFADYLINNKNNTLIYHDGNPDYDGEPNYNLEAGDYSYRYSGSNAEVNNYVCFGTETCEGENDSHLYRIIGIFKNSLDQYEVKLIKATAATPTELGDGLAFDSTSENKFYWNNTYGVDDTTKDNNYNVWKDSNLNKDNLNGYYLNTYLEEKWQDLISEHTWQVGGLSKENMRDVDAKTVYDYEVGDNKITLDNLQGCEYGENNEPCIQEVITHNAKIGLAYVSDFMYSANSKYWHLDGHSGYSQSEDEDWLTIGNTEWALTRYSNGYKREVADIDPDATVSSNYVYRIERVRPTFYLTSTTKTIGGNGSISNPFRLKVNTEG